MRENEFSVNEFIVREIGYPGAIKQEVVEELVRCRDCKWWDKSEDSPFGYCMAMQHGYMSKNWEIGIHRRYKGDFYCADAERREDADN